MLHTLHVYNHTAAILKSLETYDFCSSLTNKLQETTLKHLDRSEHFGASKTYPEGYVRLEIKGLEAKCLIRSTAKGKTILANTSKTQLQSHTKTCIFKKEQLPKSQNIHYTGSRMSTSHFKPSNSSLYQSASVPKELLHSFNSSASSQSHSPQHQPELL